MTYPDGTEGGIRNPFSSRVGIELPRLRGVNKQSDPGALADDQFQLLQNVRLDGTGIKDRPGLSEINTNAMPGCVFGLHDDRNPNDDGNALFGANRFGYGPQVWTGNADPTDSNPPWTNTNVVGKLNGQTIIIDDVGNGYSFSYETTDGTPAFTTTAVFTYTSALVNARPKGIVEWDGALWFTYSEAAGAIQVWRWTGGPTAELMKSISPAAADTSVVALGASDDLYLAYQSGMLKYDEGAWTSLTMPAGPGWNPVGYTGVPSVPYLYFSGYNLDAAVDQTLTILKVIGTTVSVASDDIPTYSGASNSYGDITLLNGFLYAVGNTTQGVDSFSLYVITGGGTSSAVANLSSQIGVAATNDDGILLQILQWRGQLFISVPLGVVNATVARADLNDPTTWTVVMSDQNITADGRTSPGGNIFTA